MRTILKDNAKHYIAVFLIMFIAFAFPVIANADSGKLRLTITDTSYNETHYYLDKGQTYPGVSYDAATNTITLTNANLGDAFLYYNGETDLTITLVGNSYMEHVGYYGSGIVMSDETAQAALTINGSGSLTMTNYIYEGIAQRDDSSEDNPVDGDIVIDGARLNFEKSSGIMSNYSDVIIKNGAYVYIDGNNDRGSYGIITGRNGEAFDTTGKLAISNSDVIMKNCTSTLAYNRLEAEGVYFYGGEADAEYVLDIKINPPFRWSLTEYGYLGATTTEKEIRTEYVNNVFVTDNAMDYTGKIVKPGIVAYNAAGDELVEGTDYDIVCTDDGVAPGHYSADIIFKGDYTGEMSVNYTIYPKKCSNVTAKLRTGNGGYKNVAFSWKASYGADGYLVYYKKTSAANWAGPFNVKKTSFNKNNLAAGTEYQFKVIPYFNDGENWYDTDQAAIVKVTTLKKVVLKKFNKKSGKVNVQWNDIKGETGYQISKSLKKNGTTIVCKNVKANKSSILVKATKGKNYYYKVRAYKNVKVGNVTKKVYGPWSAPKKFKR